MYSKALYECYPGAVYLHRAQQYLMTRVDLSTHRAHCSPLASTGKGSRGGGKGVGYTTRSDSHTEIQIIKVFPSDDDDDDDVTISCCRATLLPSPLLHNSTTLRGNLCEHPKDESPSPSSLSSLLFKLGTVQIQTEVYGYHKVRIRTGERYDHGE